MKIKFEKKKKKKETPRRFEPGGNGFRGNRLIQRATKTYVTSSQFTMYKVLP